MTEDDAKKAGFREAKRMRLRKGFIVVRNSKGGSCLSIRSQISFTEGQAITRHS